MSFLHPEFLYFMLPPLILLFVLFITQKEKRALFFSDEVMQKLRVNSNRMSLRVRNWLFFLVAVLLIMALAQPVIPDGKIQVKAKSTDIMIALDISGSMLCTDMYPSRLELAKHKVLSLLHRKPKERIGVIAFAKESYLVSPLSFDHDALSFLVKGLSSESVTQKGTDFLTLLEGVDATMKEQKQRIVLLLSDGGDQGDFTQEIAYAKEHKITVYVLALATAAGAPMKAENGFITQNGKVVISKRNEAIATLATQTGGVYIEGVVTDRDVSAMLGEIEKNSTQKTLKSQMISKYIPLFHIFIGFALLFLLLAISSMSKREVVKIPSAFLVLFLLLEALPARAGILDFELLSDAKKAYENKEYQTSSALYGKYSKEHESSEANYNYASSLYKQKRYEKAANIYKKIHFADKKKQADLFYNLGNAYAKAQKYEEALLAYKSSLTLQKSEDAKVNKAIVEKLLQEKKKQEQAKRQASQQEQQQNRNAQQQNQQNQIDQQQKQNEQQDLSEQNQPDQKSVQTQEQAAAVFEKSVQMSNKEERKWLQRLNSGSPTHIYKIKTSSQKENENAKPW